MPHKVALDGERDLMHIHPALVAVAERMLAQRELEADRFAQWHEQARLQR